MHRLGYLSKKDFEEFIDFYQKRNLEQVYKSSALKTLKTKYLPEYQEILDLKEHYEIIWVLSPLPEHLQDLLNKI